MGHAFRRKDGDYGKREHAIERARKLREQGYEAAIKEEHGRWSVYVSSNRTSDLRTKG